MTYRPPQCSRRPGCGGVTLCNVCLGEALERAGAKLLKGSVGELQLPELVHSVWPEASANETALVSQRLLRLGIAVGQANSRTFEHRFWPFMRQLHKLATVPLDPVEHARSTGNLWAAPLVTEPRLLRAGLHVFIRPRTSKVFVRRKTALNAIDIAGLSRSLRAQGIRGTPLETVYKEYPSAFNDVFSLAAQGEIVIDENMAWHTSAVAQASCGALLAWQRALAEYKLSEREPAGP